MIQEGKLDLLSYKLRSHLPSQKGAKQVISRKERINDSLQGCPRSRHQQPRWQGSKARYRVDCLSPITGEIHHLCVNCSNLPHTFSPVNLHPTQVLLPYKNECCMSRAACGIHVYVVHLCCVHVPAGNVCSCRNLASVWLLDTFSSNRLHLFADTC